MSRPIRVYFTQRRIDTVCKLYFLPFVLHKLRSCLMRNHLVLAMGCLMTVPASEGALTLKVALELHLEVLGRLADGIQLRKGSTGPSAEQLATIVVEAHPRMAAALAAVR